MSADMTQTALYRLFGEDGTLLYIGVAKTFGRRWQEHARSKPWWPQVRRQTVDWYPSRPEAFKAEEQAIWAEAPRFNIAHNRRPAAAGRDLPGSPPGTPSQGRPLAEMMPRQEIAARLGMSEAEMRRLPSVIDLAEAARVLGIEHREARQMALAGEFPCRLIVLGRRSYRVPTLVLLRTRGVQINATEARSLVINRDAA